VGPTGSGKSSLALDLAERFGGELVNCDSVQIYRYFDIGAARTPISERRGIPHHLMDVCNPDEVFTAGDYLRMGRAALHEIAGRGKLPIVTGGTGFYLRALFDGLAEGPSRDDDLRARLAVRESRRAGSLHRLLRRFDAVTAGRIHPNDVPKVMRALEICLVARRPAAELFATGKEPLTGFRKLVIGLFPNREALYERLEARLEQMFVAGILDETAGILARGYPLTAKPFEAIGYKQALQILKGELSQKDALYYARRDTRNYAKRQMTWFRREQGLEVIAGFGDDPATVAVAIQKVESFLRATTATS
jgi:tRNA dimethylallyltransferase